jgi:hypothetical protein
MKEAASDWKLWACLAGGIIATLLLPPSVHSAFNESQLFAVVIVLVRATLGVVIGVYAYLILFGAPNSK